MKLPPGDPVEDQLGDHRVGAHDDHHRGRLTEGGQLHLVAVPAGLIAAVKAAQRPFEFEGGGHHPALRAEVGAFREAPFG